MKYKMEETLELLIDRATDQSKSHESSEHFVAVWDRVNKDSDGCAVALRHLTQKIRSVNERESLCALELLEACVKNCGYRFHQEIGKFKFLNELIKMLSAKYDGRWTSPAVKKRIIELLYSWTKGLPKETKIQEAYKMLKTQGVVTSDPVDPYLATYSKEMQSPSKNTIFDDDEKSKLLARLLKSKHAEDLQAANRLIKTMVRQDELKIEKKAKRNMDIERCCNNARLLCEMLSYYQPSSPAQDKELMRELFLSCEKMRPSLFRLASTATEENDEGLAEILKANDELTRAIEEYRKKVGPEETTSSSQSPVQSTTEDTEQPPMAAASQLLSDQDGSSLIDLGLSENKQTVDNTNISVLDDELRALGIHDMPQNSTQQNSVTQPLAGISSLSWGAPQPHPNMPPNQGNMGLVRPMGGIMQGSMGYPMNQQLGMRMPPMGMSPQPGMQHMGPIRGMTPAQPRGSTPANKRGQPANKQPTSSLDLLGRDFLETQKQQQKQKQSASPVPTKKTADTAEGTLLSISDDSIPPTPPTSLVADNKPPTKPPTSSNVPSDTLLSLDNDIAALPMTKVSSEPAPLDDVFVPLDTVVPGDHPPLTALDKNSIKIVFHFAKTTANLSRSDVRIVVISIMSMLKTAVKNFVLQAAVPKSMRVKLQPPSGGDLPPYNPILPSAAITQVMLITNPNKETIRLKFRATYEVDGSTQVQAGEVDSFPPS